VKEQDSLVRLILDLFVHRSDVYPVQQPDGSYRPVWEPFTEDVVRAHLDGEMTVGTYPINPGDQTVKFLAFDVDGRDEALTGEAVRSLLSEIRKDVPGEAVLVERSRRGYHVWVFFRPPVPATFANRFGLELARRTAVPVTTKNPDLHLEVFPKQFSASEKQPGNLIKLPLGVHALSGRRTEFVSPEDFSTVLDPVSALSSVRPWSPPESLVESLSAPPKVEGRATGPVVVGDYPCWERMAAGAQEGMRHNVAFALACHFRDKGIPVDAAVALLRRWWETLPQPPRAASPYPWGDAERAVRDAYGKGYHVGCGLIRSRWPELCSPECPLRTGAGRVPLTAYHEMEAVERREVGEWVLECHGAHTVLYHPLTQKALTARGRYPGWDRWEWEAFIRLARGLGREVEEGLREAMAELRPERMGRELALFDEDAVASVPLEGEHTLEARYSRERNYIKVSGATYPAREELSAFMRWSPAEGAWVCDYSEKNLRRAVRILRKYDSPSDPAAKGLAQCWVCGSWVEPGRLRDGYCGCLGKLSGKENGSWPERPREGAG
jgi:hypothetical protein